MMTCYTKLLLYEKDCAIGELNFEENGEPITLIVDDASGLTVSKKGDYIEEKWIREKKEFIKLPYSCR